jgi:hypothetical protein
MCEELPPGKHQARVRVAKLDVSATKYLDAKPQTSQPLAYRVRAANGNGESAYSNIATLVSSGVR